MPSLLERLLGDGSSDEQEDLEDRRERAEQRLSDQVTEDVEDSGVTGVAVVNEGPDGEPVVVPIVRFSLGEDVEMPDLETVWRLAGTALDAVEPVFEGVFVRHYDVQFTFDGDGLLEAEECRRIAVTPDFADEYVHGGWDLDTFREEMGAADDIDDEIAPVVWGECTDYSDRTNAAVVTTAATSASAASCAGAASAGAGGGAC